MDALGNRTSSLYDATGRVIAQQDARGYLTSFVFDAAGRQLAVVDANGHRTSNLYDARGMVQATQDPLGAYTTYQFDGVGNTLLRVDARNWPTTYTVDALNRVTGQVYVDGTRVTFTFDSDGRQATMQDVTGVTTFQYDAAGRQTGVVNGVGKALAYSFDATGNRTVLVDPDNGRTTYSYDAQSRITGIVNPWAEATTLSYDALDREAQRVLGNGASISRGYDAGGRETLISSPVAVYTASYDAVGNRTSVVELDGSRVTYSYDASYQLTREQRSGATAIDASYAYDGLGNRLTKTDATGITTCTYNAANALVTSQAPTGVVTTSSYDANGSLTLENAGGALTTYAWDSENRMLSVAAAGQTQTNTYSADSMRQSKATATGTVHYVRDGENVFIETDASLVTVAQHTDLPGMWGGKYAQRRSGASRFYVPDFQGNTRALLDASQAATDTLITDAWGVELARTGTIEDPFKAFGQWGYFRDTASRLYVRARHLRVDQGRWMSRDPIGFDGGDWTLYGYVRNRVVTDHDPTGLQSSLFPWLPVPHPNLFLPEPTDPETPTWQAGGTCGPEVGAALRNLLIRVGQRYRSNPSSLRGMCSHFANPNGWDIYELYSDTGQVFQDYWRTQGCATCINTVSVDGQCWPAWAVNYLLFGYAFRLCHDFLNETIDLHYFQEREGDWWTEDQATSYVYRWNWCGAALSRFSQTVYRHPRDARWKSEWTKAAYRGWLEGRFPTPKSPGELSKCASCGQSAPRLDYHLKDGTEYGWY